ncbi:unnamed protein product [Auanema sp. JU1783]|nr:unnamed protein product [Auanema sp. JU1783]
MRALHIIFVIMAFKVMASNTKIQKSLYEKIPLQLRSKSSQYNFILKKSILEYVPMIAFNAYNMLDAEEREKVAVVAKDFQSTKDVNGFFQEVVAISPQFAKQIIYLHHIRGLAIASEIDEEKKEKTRLAADTAFNLGVAFLSGDKAYQEEAEAEADKYKI